MSDPQSFERGVPGEMPLDRAPATAATARSQAGALARRLADQEVRLSIGVDLLEGAEGRALEQLDALTRVTTRLAEAGGVQVSHDLAAPVPTDDALHPAVIEAEEILREQRRRLGRGPGRRTREGVLERRLAVAVSFVGFVVLGYISSAIGGMIPGDALSRVGSGQSVLFSRDPHLEAIGFIWGPFPTLFQLPFIALRWLWLPLTSAGMAAIIVSALFMAGTLSQLLAWGRETGSSRWFRIAATLLVVAHPLIWTHGANGMSEACWLFFLMLATRHLSRWIETDDTRSLVIVGVAIAMGYLTRYETAAVFAAVLCVVAVTSWARSAGDGPAPRPELTRRRETILDLAILSFPVVVTMLAWAGASWAIIGEPFPQFTSDYGNSALVRSAVLDNIALIGDAASAGRAWFFIRQLVIVSPLLVVLALVAFWGSRRTSLRALSAVAVLGSPLALQVLFATKGSTFPWLRYTVGGVLLAGALAMVVDSDARARGSRWVRVLALVALVPGIAWSTHVINADEYAPFDQKDSFESLALGVDGDSAAVVDSVSRTGQEAAADIDAMPDVEPGTVLIDQAGIGVLPAAPRPDVYVVPSDRDFEPALSAPEDFGIRYILLVESSGADQVSGEFPDMWESGGAPLTRQVAEWGSASEPKTHLRLFQVVDPDPRNRAEPDPEFGR